MRASAKAQVEDRIRYEENCARSAEIRVGREMDRMKGNLLRLVKMIDQEMMDDKQYEMYGHGKAENRQSFDERVGKILNEVENVMGNLRLQVIMNEMHHWAGHGEFARRIEWMLRQQ